jgi:energy-coupling factor transporter transmembrane protein EcfT
MPQLQVSVAIPLIQIAVGLLLVTVSFVYYKREWSDFWAAFGWGIVSAALGILVASSLK